MNYQRNRVGGAAFAGRPANPHNVVSGEATARLYRISDRNDNRPMRSARGVVISVSYADGRRTIGRIRGECQCI